MIYSMENHRSSYYSVTYGPTGLKISHYTIHQQEGHTCPKRRIAQAEIRLATAVITFRKEGKKC